MTPNTRLHAPHRTPHPALAAITFTTRPNHRRPHDGVLAAWADAMRAPANAPVVHGDKEKPELTRQYDEGYKVDLAEPTFLVGF